MRVVTRHPRAYMNVLAAVLVFDALSFNSSAVVLSDVCWSHADTCPVRHPLLTRAPTPTHLPCLPHVFVCVRASVRVKMRLGNVGGRCARSCGTNRSEHGVLAFRRLDKSVKSLLSEMMKSLPRILPLKRAPPVLMGQWLQYARQPIPGPYLKWCVLGTQGRLQWHQTTRSQGLHAAATSEGGVGLLTLPTKRIDQVVRVKLFAPTGRLNQMQTSRCRMTMPARAQLGGPGARAWACFKFNAKRDRLDPDSARERTPSGRVKVTVVTGTPRPVHLPSLLPCNLKHNRDFGLLTVLRPVHCIQVLKDQPIGSSRLSPSEPHVGSESLRGSMSESSLRIRWSLLDQ